MNTHAKKAVVICPGRGTYNKNELGYLHRYHADKHALIQGFDGYRQQQRQATISELDQAGHFDPRIHTVGDNASSLIYACAYADFLSINQHRFEVVAVTGNSMGWYIALACAGVLSAQNALHLVNSMGNLMSNQAAGGQLVYPLLDANWQPVEGRSEHLDAIQSRINQQPDCELYDSIHLGGLRVFAGNNSALNKLEKALPVAHPYPLRLQNHGAFHSPMMQHISAQAMASIAENLFENPGLALIDGRAAVWTPHASDPTDLWHYTLGTQITETYYFTRAVQTCVQEFAPDCLIIPGPGNTLGGATAQALIDIQWHGINNKHDFIASQKSDPFILSMGLESQRLLVSN